MNRFAKKGLAVLHGAGKGLEIGGLTLIGGVAMGVEKTVPVAKKVSAPVVNGVKKGVAKVGNARVEVQARHMVRVVERAEEIRNKK